MEAYEKKSKELTIVFHNPNTTEKFEKYIKNILIEKLCKEIKQKKQEKPVVQ